MKSVQATIYFNQYTDIETVEEVLYGFEELLEVSFEEEAIPLTEFDYSILRCTAKRRMAGINKDNLYYVGSTVEFVVDDGDQEQLMAALRSAWEEVYDTYSLHRKAFVEYEVHDEPVLSGVVGVIAGADETVSDQAPPVTGGGA